MFFLRQGATHKVLIGPVVAVANGYVPVTTLALTTADEAEALVHDSATVVDISGYTFAAVTNADGYYVLTLQSGITGTVGHMTVLINDDSLCLPVKAEFTVLEEAVYDALYAASAAGFGTAQTGDSYALANGANGFVAIKADTAAILVDTGTTLDGRIPAALTADGNMKSDTLRVGGTLQTAGDLAALITAVDDIIDTEFPQLVIDVASILADTGTDGVVVAAASKTGYQLSATGVDDIADEVYEGALTLRQIMRILLASAAGKLSGAATTTVAIRDNADTKDRISATVDADGNRSAVVLDVT